MTLDAVKQLDDILEESFQHPVVLFKHSTRCSISAMAKSRLERESSAEDPVIYYLDLIAYRDVSNAIESRFGVRHESPQVILLKDGKVVYHASHGAINIHDLKSYAA